MPQGNQNTKIKLKESYFYYDSALSWLSFNSSVLEEAMNPDIPVYERIRFLAIHQSNFEKFYRTAVTSRRLMLNLEKNNLNKSSNKINEILDKIYYEAEKQYASFESIFRLKIIPELAAHNILLIQGIELEEDHKEYSRQFFVKEILPHLQPIMLNKGETVSYIEDNELYLAVILTKKKNNPIEEKSEIKKNAYALVKIPLYKLPRFIELPSKDLRYYYIFIEDIIKLCLGNLFPLFNVEAAYSIYLLRNTKLKIEDDLNKKHARQMHKTFSEQNTGFPAMFKFDERMPVELLKMLKKSLNLQNKDLSTGYQNLKLSDLSALPNPFKPKLEAEVFLTLRHPIIDNELSILKAIKKKDIILHFPYHTYDYIIHFFNEAATDPKVEEIRTTQYKLENNAAIISSLISAALNGKKVIVYVDFKARFDYARDFNFIEQLTKAGIRIIPSIPAYKVHAKAALVTRKSSSKDGKRRAFAYLSTGNYNEKTALQYSDHGLFTSRSEITEDLKKLFVFLEKPEGSIELAHLIVPKFKFRETIQSLISNEIKNASNGVQAHIIIKTNNLEDKKFIRQLYMASQTGVSADLIIRGICCLAPNQSFSKNIRVIRIIDRFLEHSRIFVFHNNGFPKVFISSADMVKTNIKRRIDLIVPVYDEDLKNELIKILEFQLMDNTKSRILKNEVNNWQIPEPTASKIQSQSEIYQYLKSL